MRDRGSLLRSRVAAYDVINVDVINVDVTNVDVTNVDVTNVDVTNVESHRRRLPRSFSDFLLDGPLQVRCPGVPDVYHHCVIGAKGRRPTLRFRCGGIFVRAGAARAHTSAG